jgi:hypothetical protein
MVLLSSFNTNTSYDKKKLSSKTIILEFYLPSFWISLEQKVKNIVSTTFVEQLLIMF